MRRTGVPVIDSVVGGLGPGLPLVLAGPPGCGRTVLALELVAAALAEHDIVALLSSEPAPLLLQQAASLGHTLTESVVQEQLILLELDPVAPASLAAAGGKALIEAIHEQHPAVSMIVIDPLTMLTADIMDEAPLRAIARDLVAATPRSSLVLCVETDRPELEAPVERVLAEVCGSYVALERDLEGTRTLRVSKTRAGVGRAEAVEFAIGSAGVELVRVVPRALAASAGHVRAEAAPAPAPDPPEAHQAIAARVAPASAPVSAPEAAAVTPSVPATPPAPRVREGLRKILIVDDDDEARAELRLWLGEGFEISEARDGLQAVAMSLSQRPDLMVLDLEMPRVSGYEVLHALCGMEAGIPTLAVLPCAPTRAGERLAPMVLGATELVHKPLDRFDVVNKCELLVRLESPPGSQLDPEEAKALFDFSSHTRVISAERFRNALTRAHQIGSRFGMASTVLTIQANSAPALDELRAAADEVLRFEDALCVMSKRRMLMLLVAAERQNADAVLSRIVSATSLEGAGARLHWSAFDAEEAAAVSDWRQLFREELDVGES